jgi:serine/threonine-protein kinase
MATELDNEARDFLRRRIAIFGFVSASIGGSFLLLRVALPTHLGGSAASHLTHLGAVLAFLAVWIFALRRDGDTRYLRAVEAAGLIAGGGFYTLMGLFIPAGIRPELIMSMAMTAMMVIRAIYVPSSGRRSAVLTGAVGVPLLISCYAAWSSMPAEAFAAYISSIGSTTSQPVMAAVRTMETGAWWLAAVAIATLASRVIYGLRREVRESRKLGQYTIEAKLGEGGMGAVYRARHAMLRRPTAVKLLRADRELSELARFEREVQRTAELTHPNTITIFDYGRTPDGIFYYAMELLDGVTLNDVIERDGPQPVGRVVKILSSVLGALTEAHAAGLIHRDIKPANIMLVVRGGIHDVPKVLDFGLVKEIDRDRDLALTDDDMVMGTPLYMAPEMIRGEGVIDGRTDLYAVGAVAYYLLTGTHVFSGKSVIDVCSRHLSDPPEPPSTRLGEPVDPDLEALILACLAKDPADRPASASAAAQRLATCDVTPWTETDAARWWSDHRAGERRAADAKKSLAGLAETVAVDLARR